MRQWADQQLSVSIWLVTSMPDHNLWVLTVHPYTNQHVRGKPRAQTIGLGFFLGPLFLPGFCQVTSVTWSTTVKVMLNRVLEYAKPLELGPKPESRWMTFSPRLELRLQTSLCWLVEVHLSANTFKWGSYLVHQQPYPIPLPTGQVLLLPKVVWIFESCLIPNLAFQEFIPFRNILSDAKEQITTHYHFSPSLSLPRIIIYEME